MSTVIEDRYRSLLRVLPAGYRAEWEEEMVATFLHATMTGDEDLDDYLADHGRPPWPEVASVLALAVRLRLPASGDAGVPARYRVTGNAVRLVVLIGLLVQATTALVGLGVALWLLGRVPGVEPSPVVAGLIGPASMAVVLLACAAVPAYVAFVTGRLRAARALAALAAGALVVHAVAGLVSGDPVQLTRWVPLLIDVLLVAAVWAFHDPPPVHRRPWLVALPAGTAVVAAVVVATAYVGVARWAVDWAGLCCAAVVAGLAAHLVAGRRRDRPAGAAWSLAWSRAWSLLAATVLVQRLVTMPEVVVHAGPGERTALLAACVAEAVAVVAAGLPVAVRARRALHGPPAAVPARLGRG